MDLVSKLNTVFEISEVEYIFDQISLETYNTGLENVSVARLIDGERFKIQRVYLEKILFNNKIVVDKL